MLPAGWLAPRLATALVGISLVPLSPRLGVGGGHGFGFGRTSKPEEDREDDENSRRQKLALPVLKGLEPELRAGEVLGH